ncbi:hypothetical protein KUCAC02_037172 [Chaenocephalus aceratus]|nr:hypothetical protein KUCAC02_037172 [Chaenocephalus aceratus]
MSPDTMSPDTMSTDTMSPDTMSPDIMHTNTSSVMKSRRSSKPCRFRDWWENQSYGHTRDQRRLQISGASQVTCPLQCQARSWALWTL